MAQSVFKIIQNLILPMYYNLRKFFPSELAMQVLPQGCYSVPLSGFFCLILASMLS
jgi:hypothetical protein